MAISLMVNLPRLSTLRNGAIASQFVVFNPYEFFFQWGYNCLFCYLVFAYNLRNRGRFRLRPGQNLLLLLAAFVIGAFLQRQLFHAPMIRQIYRFAYFARLFVCMVVELLVIRILFLLRETRAKELETEQAKTKFVKAELELMKQQLNPHFFFNSLSTLSGIVRENPAKAQRFIGHLSRIFRNLLQTREPLVTLKEELRDLEAYTELLYMRFESSIVITITIPEEYYDKKLPHLSLQPLIENAAKHNKATIAAPLYINVFVQDGGLYVQNNLQPVGFVQEQSGTGLFNLNERYRILLGQEIIITRTDLHFMVILPIATNPQPPANN
jgi:LytS/YehU family sensor histidine kinase